MRFISCILKAVSPDFDEIATFLRLRLRRRALLLFLTSLDDPVLAENFARATKLLARRHLVLAGMLRPAVGSSGCLKGMWRVRRMFIGIWRGIFLGRG